MLIIIMSLIIIIIFTGPLLHLSSETCSNFVTTPKSDVIAGSNLFSFRVPSYSAHNMCPPRLNIMKLDK